jgi:hypothetical protein
MSRTAAGCCQRAWLVDHMLVPRAKHQATVAPSPGQRLAAAAKSRPAARAEKREAASFPARAHPVSSRAKASRARAKTGAAITAGSTG